MSWIKNPGRFAGLLYLLMGLPAPFALIYVPGKLIVRGNATATANNIAANESLFRLGIAAQLISQTLFIFVVLALYDLLKDVNKRHAAIMVILVLVSIPIAFLNELNSIAALVIVRGGDFLSAIQKPQRDALVLLLLKLHSEGLGVVQIFWGLWLLPLGLLVYRSRFIPRIIGVLLIVNAFAYPLTTLVDLILPEYGPAVARSMTLAQFGELWFILWLLIRGANPPLANAPA